jgi:hypothetical protein
LILVADTGELIPALKMFYGALGLSFRPESVGDLPAGVPRVMGALSTEVSERYGAVEKRLGKTLLAKVRSLRGEWRVVPETR